MKCPQYSANFDAAKRVQFVWDSIMQIVGPPAKPVYVSMQKENFKKKKEPISTPKPAKKPQTKFSCRPYWFKKVSKWYSFGHIFSPPSHNFHPP